MATRIQMKRGTAASWAAANPILSDGEIGFETDTSKIKIGNGTSTWTALNYFPADWSALTGKPAVIASGATELEARTAIGLSNVENTADSQKNVATAGSAAVAGEATKLQTPRTINGVSFDGTANITIPTGISRSVQNITESSATIAAETNKDHTLFVTGSANPGSDTDVVILLHCEGSDGATSMPDSSLVSPNQTLLSSAFGKFVGTAALSTTQKKFGNTSIYFPGGSSVINGPSIDSILTSRYQFGTGDFTIEFWYYPLVGGYQALYWQEGGAFIQLNGTTIRFMKHGAGELIGLTGNMPLNQWHHFAASRVSNTLRLFANGTQIGSSVTDNNNYLSVGRIALGSEGLFGAGAFNGYMDEIRVTKGRGRYTSNFTVPTAAFPDPVPASLQKITLPSLSSNTNKYEIFNRSSGKISVQTTSPDKIETVPTALFNDGTVNNSSPTGASRMWTGTATSSSTVKKFTTANSLYFFNSVMRPTTNADPSYAFGTNNFTIDFYVYRSDTVDRVIYDGRSGTYGTGGYGGPFPIIYFAGNKIRFAKADAFEITSTTTFAINTWYHVAVCRNNSFTMLYVNGIAEAASPDTGNYLNIQVSHYASTGACTPYIGATNTGTYSDSWGPSFFGYLSHFRIFNGTALYSGPNFTPPDNNMGADSLTLDKSSMATVMSDGSLYRILPT